MISHNGANGPESNVTLMFRPGSQVAAAFPTAFCSFIAF